MKNLLFLFVFLSSAVFADHTLSELKREYINKIAEKAFQKKSKTIKLKSAKLFVINYFIAKSKQDSIDVENILNLTNSELGEIGGKAKLIELENLNIAMLSEKNPKGKNLNEQFENLALSLIDDSLRRIGANI